MPIDSVTLKCVDDEGGLTVDKVLRLRVVKNNGPVSIGFDTLFLDVMNVYEDFTTEVATKIGADLAYYEDADHPEVPVSEGATPKVVMQEVEATTEQKCIGSFTLNLDEAIEALTLLKNHGT